MKKCDQEKISPACMTQEIYYRLKRMAEDGVPLKIIIKHTNLPEDVIRHFIKHNLEKHIHLYH